MADSPDTQWPQKMPRLMQNSAVNNELSAAFRVIQVAMLLLASMMTTLMLIVGVVREMPAANIGVLCLVCALFWAYPLAIQFFNKRYAYATTVSWVTVLGLVILL